LTCSVSRSGFASAIAMIWIVMRPLPIFPSAGEDSNGAVKEHGLSRAKIFDWIGL
jgi:hypothetical protein